MAKLHRKESVRKMMPMLDNAMEIFAEIVQ